MVEVTISLPEGLISLIDEVARAEERTRGELLHEAIADYLREKGKLHRWEDPVVLKAIATQRRIAQLAEGEQSDAVAEIRKMRESRR